MSFCICTGQSGVSFCNTEVVLTECDELAEGLVALHLARVHGLVRLGDVAQPQDAAVLAAGRLRPTRFVLQET